METIKPQRALTLAGGVVMAMLWTADAGAAAAAAAATAADHQHDFDFEFGAWHVRIKRLLHPLTHSDQWAEYQGLSTVRKVWDGRANLGELEVDGPGHLEGFSLRVYSPQSHQWSIYWCNSRDGELGKPMIGDFTNGRGEFYDQESLDGRGIFVRFIFSDITAASFRLEQAFSADGGRSWEANWIAVFDRQGP